MLLINFLDRRFPNWERLSVRELNRRLQRLGPQEFRLRHRNTDVEGRLRVAWPNARQATFCDGRNWVTVEEYFERRYQRRLRFPHIPLFFIEDPRSLYPVEVLEIYD